MSHLPSPTRLLVAACAVALALTTACSSSTPPSDPVQTGTFVPPATSAPRSTAPGTNPPGTATPGTLARPTGTSVSGACPEGTMVTVKTKAGDKVITGTASRADITLDTSAKIIIANYDVPEAEVKSVYNPALTGDQLGLQLYITTSGTRLENGDYLPVGSNPDAKLKLNNESLYSSSGREIASGFADPEAGVAITEITSTHVCGVVRTNNASGAFIAEIV